MSLKVYLLLTMMSLMHWPWLIVMLTFWTILMNYYFTIK